MPGRIFLSPDFESPPDGMPPQLTSYLTGLAEKLRQVFAEIEDVSRSRDQPAGNFYDISPGSPTTLVRTVSGTSTSTATSTDPAMYQLIRELKLKGFIR